MGDTRPQPTVIIRRKRKSPQEQESEPQGRMLGLVLCEHCGAPLSYVQDGKVKLRVKSKLIAFREDGTAEMPCPKCHKDTTLPKLRLTFSQQSKKIS